MIQGNDLLKVVYKILTIKDEIKEINIKRVQHYQKYKDLLGQEQELERQKNESIEELEVFRTNGNKKTSEKN